MVNEIFQILLPLYLLINQKSAKLNIKNQKTKLFIIIIILYCIEYTYIYIYIYIYVTYQEIVTKNYKISATKFAVCKTLL